MASSVSISVNPFTVALGVILVIVFTNRPRLTVFAAVLFAVVFVIARRVRRRQGVRGTIREQIAQIRDNGFIERSLLGDLDRALDLILDEYILDRFMGPSASTPSIPGTTIRSRKSSIKKR